MVPCYWTLRLNHQCGTVVWTAMPSIWAYCELAFTKCYWSPARVFFFLEWICLYTNNMKLIKSRDLNTGDIIFHKWKLSHAWVISQKRNNTKGQDKLHLPNYYSDINVLQWELLRSTSRHRIHSEIIPEWTIKSAAIVINFYFVFLYLSPQLEVLLKVMASNFLIYLFSLLYYLK